MGRVNRVNINPISSAGLDAGKNVPNSARDLFSSPWIIPSSVGGKSALNLWRLKAGKGDTGVQPSQRRRVSATVSFAALVWTNSAHSWDEIPANVKWAGDKLITGIPMYSYGLRLFVGWREREALFSTLCTVIVSHLCAGALPFCTSQF